MSYLCPFLFLAALTVLITTTIISHPCSLLTTNNDQFLLPHSLHHQLSHLQTQLGSLLQQLHHTAATDPDHQPDYRSQAILVAVSLDKFLDQFSLVQSNGASNKHLCDDVEVDEYTADNYTDEADGDFSGNQPFSSSEAKNYIAFKPNRGRLKNFLGVDAVYPSVGQTCTAMLTNIDRYMSYKPYGLCPDDWNFGQKLMLAGCEPLPRRRCFSRSPSGYTKPFPVNTSLWSPPDEHNILWSHYKCKGFNCLLSKSANKGFYKCSDCFNLNKRGWGNSSSMTSSPEFAINEVLALKPGEIRIGLDFSPTTGTFAALMKERNVTIVSATMNLGAPFNEAIALRGLVPIYVSVGSRLPFFDNTLDIIHTALFLDGWIALELLEYILFDWDRVLRPRGILWVDRFFCTKDEMKIYLNVFGKLGYKKLLWRILPKTDRSGNELFFSAVLEKPLRS